MRIILFVFIFTLTSFASLGYAAAAETRAEQSKRLADEAIALYESIPKLSADDRTVTPTELERMTLRELRHAAYDAYDEVLVTDIETVLPYYRKRAKEQNSSRDLKIANIHELFLSGGDFTPYKNDEDWFVAFTAVGFESFAALYADTYYVRLSAVEDARLLIPGPSDPLYNEAQFVLANLATVFHLHRRDIEELISASKAIHKYGKLDNRKISSAILAGNIAVAHAAKYRDEHASRITAHAIADIGEKKIPEFDGLNIQHANTLFEQKKYAEALRYYSRTVHQEIDYWTVFKDQRLAITNYYLGNFKDAKINRERVTDYRLRNPSSPHIDDEYEFAMALLDLETKDTETGIESLKRAMADIAAQYERKIEAVAKSTSVKYTDNTNVSRKLNARLTDLRPINMGNIDQPGEIPTGKRLSLNTTDRAKLNSIKNISMLASSGRIQEIDAGTHARHAFMDTIFERGTTESPKIALNKYKAAIGSSPSKEEIEIFEIFSKTVVLLEKAAMATAQSKNASEYLVDDLYTPVALDLLQSQTFSDDAKAYAYVIDAYLSLASGRFDKTWNDILSAKNMIGLSGRVKSEIEYELSQIEIILLSMEGNYAQVLDRSVKNLSLALSQNRNLDHSSVLYYTATTLLEAGLFEEAFELADIYVSKTDQMGDDEIASAYLLKARLSNAVGDFNSGIIYLERALSKNPDDITRIIIQRELYIAYAGSGISKDALRLRRAVSDSLRSLPNERVIDSTKVILAKGDYLLSRATNKPSIDQDFRNWVSLESDFNYSRKISQSALVAQRSTAIDRYLTGKEKIALGNSIDIVELSRSNSVKSGFIFAMLLALCAAIASLVGLQKRRLARERQLLKNTETQNRFLSLIEMNTKTQLSAIATFTESLKKSSIPMQHQPIIDIIGKNTGNLSSDLSGLVFAAKLLSGNHSLNPRRFHVDELTQRLQLQMNSHPEKTDVGLHIEFDVPSNEISADLLLLESAIGRVLNQAITRTDVGSVRLLATAVKSGSKEFLVIKVVDTGTGLHSVSYTAKDIAFALQDIENGVLDDLNRLDGALVYHAVNLLGGSINVKSNPGAGSETTITVPIEFENSKKSIPANDTNIIKFGS